MESIKEKPTYQEKPWLPLRKLRALLDETRTGIAILCASLTLAMSSPAYISDQNFQNVGTGGADLVDHDLFIDHLNQPEKIPVTAADGGSKKKPELIRAHLFKVPMGYLYKTASGEIITKVETVNLVARQRRELEKIHKQFPDLKGSGEIVNSVSFAKEIKDLQPGLAYLKSVA